MVMFKSLIHPNKFKNELALEPAVFLFESVAYFIIKDI